MSRCLMFLFLILMILMCYCSAFGKNINYEILGGTGAETIMMYKMAHDEAIDSAGVGLFYGSDSPYGRDTKREDNIGTLIFPPAPTDCLGWCLLVLKETFEKSQMKEEWLKINRTAFERSKKSPISKFMKETGIWRKFQSGRLAVKLQEFYQPYAVTRRGCLLSQ